jgi:hypothetical protein
MWSRVVAFCETSTSRSKRTSVADGERRLSLLDDERLRIGVVMQAWALARARVKQKEGHRRVVSRAVEAI